MSARNTLTAAVVCACLFGAVALADEPTQPSTQAAGAPAVLLFRSGRTAEGHVTETATHYVVSRTVGKIEVSKADVEAVFNDLDEVYRFKAKKINDSDPDEHRRLADWCLLANLPDHAIKELERAASLSPDPKRYEALLQGVRRSVESAKKAPTTRDPDARPDSVARPAASAGIASGELTPELISRFSIQVQPMLARSCSTAGCHDGARRRGLIVRRSPRPSLRTTQQNLNSVLAHVDPEHFQLSPILTYAVRAHGEAASPPLARGAEDPALATLHHWLRDLVASAAKPAATPEPATATADGFVQNPYIVSNKPVRPTASRIRSRMIAPAATSDPAASTTSTTQTAPQPAPPDKTKPTTSTPSPVPSEPARPVPSDTGATAATPVAPSRAGESSGTQTRNTRPTTSKTRSDRTSPAANSRSVDPFDPDIFNGQFAPRPAGDGS